MIWAQVAESSGVEGWVVPVVAASITAMVGLVGGYLLAAALRAT